MNSHFGNGTIPIVMDDVACTSTENKLVNCKFDGATGDCNHGEDAGVKCYKSGEGKAYHSLHY